MLVPADAVTPDADVPAEHHLAARIRAAQPVVESDRSRVRLTVGVSAPGSAVTLAAGALIPTVSLTRDRSDSTTGWAARIRAAT